MKIHNGTSDVQIVGDINSNKVGIDMCNVDFITTILSSNLYSNPIKSLIRETVSNAWDSHIEKGCKDPIIIELKNEFVSENVEPKHYFRVRDFGVGLTKERFDTIYRNIGSSTKRTDNQQIGGWGLGRFSPLSYTDTVYITSYAEGIKTKYIMYKDNNSIKIDEIFSSKLEKEETGLEIFIYIKNSDVENFCKSICSELLYFDNIYVDLNITQTNRYWNSFVLDDIQTFNSITYATYNTFKIAKVDFKSLELFPKCSILLGNVLYSIKWNNINKYYFKYNSYPIALRFNIGELEVTPNREEILYSEANINKINERFAEFENELNQLIDKASVNYDNAADYYYSISTLNNHNLKLKNDITLHVEQNLSLYKGKRFDLMDSDILHELNIIMRFALDSKFSVWTVEDKIYNHSTNERYSIACDFIRDLHNKAIVNCDVTALKPVSKAYLRDNSQYKICLNNHVFDPFKDLLKHVENKISNSSYRPFLTELAELRKDFCDSLVNWYDKLDTFDNSSVPELFIQSYKNTKSRSDSGIVGVNWNSEISIHYQFYNNDYRKLWATRRYKYSDIAVNTAGKTIVYGKVSNEDMDKLYCYLGNAYKTENNIIFWKIADTKIHLIESLNLSNFIKIEDYIEKIKDAIIKNHTAIEINKIIPGYGITLYDLEEYPEFKAFLDKCRQYVNTYHLRTIFNGYYSENDLNKYFIEKINPESNQDNIYDPVMYKYIKDNDNVLKCLQILNTMDLTYYDKNGRAFLLSLLKDKNLLKLHEKEEQLIKENTIFKTL